MASKLKKQDIKVIEMEKSALKATMDLLVLKDRIKELNEQKTAFHDNLIQRLGDDINVENPVRNDLENGISICICPPAQQLRFSAKNYIEMLKNNGYYDEAVKKNIVYTEHEIKFPVRLAPESKDAYAGKIEKMLKEVSNMPFDKACEMYVSLSSEYRYKEHKLEEVKENFKENFINKFVEQNGEDAINAVRLIDSIGNITFSISDTEKVNIEKISEIEGISDDVSYYTVVNKEKPTVTIMLTEDLLKLKEKIGQKRAEKKRTEEKDFSSDDAEFLMSLEA